jgi:uncharacterized repeat protein (TIGR01451 family)
MTEPAEQAERSSNESRVAKGSSIRSTLTLGDRIGLWGATGAWAGALVGIAALTLGVLVAVGVLGGQTVENALGNGSIINRGTIIYNGPSQAPVAANCPEKPFPSPSPGNNVFIRMAAKDSAVPTPSTCWQTAIAARPSQTVRYLIEYMNGSTAVQNQVVIRVNLAPGVTLVPNSTHLADEAHPDGILYYSNNIAAGGIIIGNYGSGSNAFVMFSVTLPFPAILACGLNTLTSVGVARPATLDEFENSAIVKVTNPC